MPSPLPYLEWYHRDFLSSSTVNAMSLVAEGIYRRLLDFQWEDEHLKDDPRRLAALARATPEQWEDFAPWLDECFPLCKDGNRRNSRMADDRLKVQQKVQRNRENASKGGRATAKHSLDGGEPIAPPTAPPNAQAIGTPNAPPNGKPKESNRSSERKANATANAQANAKPIPASAPDITVPSGTDGDPPSAEPGRTPFDEVNSVLSIVCTEFGWGEPLPKDVRRHLKTDSALRTLVGLFGIDQAAAMFVWAHREWVGKCSWEAVFDKRNQIIDSMKGRKIDSPQETQLPDEVRYRKIPMEGIDFWRRSKVSGKELPIGRFEIGGETEKLKIGSNGERLTESFDRSEWFEQRGLVEAVT